ncbi:threonine--tRNA ligase [Paracoccaceae bacterium]|nr:threonine--tRNA ligase [Paracoccaceae bacterium]
MSLQHSEDKKIVIELSDGSLRNYTSGITGFEIAEQISPSLAKKSLACSIDGHLTDLSTRLTKDCSLTLHTIKDAEIALELIRHDCAHILARAVQEIWPDVKVTIGPVIQDGFFYDFDKKEPFSENDIEKIEKLMRSIIAKKDLVRKETWDRKRALEFYKEKNEPYKVELIQDIPNDQDIKMYWHGDWQDLCRGPHLVNTGQVPADAFKLTRVAGAYWRGDSKNKMLQRIYGVAFRSKDELKQYFFRLEEAEKRDHRKIGREMGLFHLQEEATGSIFWHPNGWKLYSTLQEYMSRKLENNGYLEVKTPQIVDRRLWEKSGHWDKFRENMFIVEVDEQEKAPRINALKPMNCPCHVQIYNQGLKSYRDLPLRMAEFGACHRNEPSGALHGLMRVRAFLQDDAHIFCTEQQIESETKRFIDLLSTVYEELGFEEFKIKFSDRPVNRAGSDQVWDRAEQALKSATTIAGYNYVINKGEGAFYGPKLEFVLTDALGRDWQCGTLQVDFVLPERLGSTYINDMGEKQIPVMLHRAILGSFERFIGILIENTTGRLPLWLAPTQIVIASITTNVAEYTDEVEKSFKNVGLRCKVDNRNEKINYKVREHSLSKIPVIAVVGEKEIETRSVNLRRLGSKESQIVSLDAAISALSMEAIPPDIRAEKK